MDEKQRKKFGLFLRELRVLVADLTLRAAAEATAGTVSNAYLSQLETGQIATPSPHIIMKLAEVYGISEKSMMLKAGYIKVSKGERQTTPIATLLEQAVTDKEKDELIRYLKFIRAGYKNKTS